MKNLAFVSCFLLSSSLALAAWNSSVSDGDWSDPSIWSEMMSPTVGDGTDGVNIMSNVFVSGTESYDKGIFLKSNSSLTLLEGGSLTFATSSYLPMDGGQLIFLGGNISIAHYIFHNNTSEYIFGGMDPDGIFKAAAAKSINSSFVVQLNSGHTTTYNVGTSNLLTTKSTGMDENAIIWAGNQLNPLSGDFLIDVTNIDTTSLEEGEYYVALAAFNNTGGTPFENLDPHISDSCVETDAIKIKGLEWANTNNTYNTLYAVLQYTPVPEPSTCAAIFGVLALAFAVYRRKRS